MSDPQQARSIFLEAVEKHAPDQWGAFLDEACGQDQELRQRVEVLLRAHGQANSLLDAPAPALGQTIDEPTTERPGTVIGPYKLLEQIGEGGFGIVFMAEQTEPVRRKVALKILKPGMDRRQVVARFEAERQALAIMDHPNIAKVHDGGATPSGRPYFVMELVRGVPITEFCDQNHLTPQQRLELFIPVCQAVQHAHQKGIIHRDLKPSNVLVTVQDTKPEVKVIDFGVAKALGQELTDKTLFTGFAQMVGTPLYMSPEQAGQSGLDIDTRSDIYSLGVLLYELLTGTTPFDRERFKRAAYEEIRRIIREEEPPRPSTRLSESKDSLPSISAQRHTEPAKLTRLVRGDLDWIVMKALEKDRNRRYETASAFAADVQRYLNDEPVHACPPSAWYRFRKFARRHRTALTVATLMVVVLGLATAISSWAALDAIESERLAEQRLENEQEARAAAVTAQDESEQRRLEAVREKNEKEKALVKVREEKTRADENLARARKAVKDYFFQVADNRRLKEADLHTLRRDLLASAVPFYEEFVKQMHDDPELEEERAYAYGDLAMLRGHLGDLEKALAGHEQRRVIFARLAAKFPKKPGYREAVAQSYRNIGNVYKSRNQPDKAEAAMREALRLMDALYVEYPTFPPYRHDLAGMCGNLGIILRKNGRPDEALRYQKRAFDLFARLVAEFPSAPNHRHGLALCHANLGALYRDLSRPADALKSKQRGVELLGKLAAEFPTNPEYRGDWASLLNNMSVMLCELGRRNEGLEAQQQALRIQEKLADDFPSMLSYRQDLGMSRVNLAVLLMDLDRNKEALAVCDQAVETLDRLAQEGPPLFPVYRQGLALAHSNRGEILRRLNRYLDAINAFKKALPIEEKLVKDFRSVPRYRQDLAMTNVNLGELLAMMGRYGEAKAIYEKALPIREKLARDFPANKTYAAELGACYGAMGTVVQFSGDPEAALEWYKKGLAQVEPVLAEEPELALARQFAAVIYGGRAHAYEKLERYADGVKDCDQALPLADEPQRRVGLQQLRAELLARSKASVPPTPAQVGDVLSGTLDKDDPADTFPMTQKSYRKVYAVPLEAGQPYLIDLESKQFDTFLRVEDAKNKPLLFNDDVRPPDDLNSRLVFLPPQKDTYRLIVRPYKAGETGSYTLRIQKAVKTGKPTLVEDKLQDTDMKNRDGRYFKMHKLDLVGGSPYTVELESDAFDTFLVLLNGPGTQVLAQYGAIAPGNKKRTRIDLTPNVDAAFKIIVTSSGPGATGAYRLTVQRYEAEKQKSK
jgi:serine/threonine protein kinase/tetratricopeptide (TPR) repeat protein